MDLAPPPLEERVAGSRKRTAGAKTRGKSSGASLIQSLASEETREPEQALLPEFSDIESDGDFDKELDGDEGCGADVLFEGEQSIAKMLLRRDSPVEGMRGAFIDYEVDDHNEHLEAALREEWFSEDEGDGSHAARMSEDGDPFTDDSLNLYNSVLSMALAPEEVIVQRQPQRMNSETSNLMSALMNLPEEDSTFPGGENMNEERPPATVGGRGTPSSTSTAEGADGAGDREGAPATRARAGSIARSLRSVRWGVLEGEAPRPPAGPPGRPARRRPS